MNAPSNTPSIERDEFETNGRYWTHVDGHLAEMTYSKAGDAMIIIDHTAVPDVLRGRHIGETMVHRSVEDARAENRKIVPLCPFAKAQIVRHPEWQDVL